MSLFIVGDTSAEGIILLQVFQHFAGPATLTLFVPDLLLIDLFPQQGRVLVRVENVSLTSIVTITDVLL